MLTGKVGACCQALPLTHLYAVFVVVVDGNGDDFAAAGLIIRVVKLRNVWVRQGLSCCQPLVGVELHDTATAHHNRNKQAPLSDTAHLSGQVWECTRRNLLRAFTCHCMAQHTTWVGPSFVQALTCSSFVSKSSASSLACGNMSAMGLACGQQSTTALSVGAQSTQDLFLRGCVAFSIVASRHRASQRDCNCNLPASRCSSPSLCQQRGSGWHPGLPGLGDLESMFRVCFPCTSHMFTHVLFPVVTASARLTRARTPPA